MKNAMAIHKEMLAHEQKVEVEKTKQWQENLERAMELKQKLEKKGKHANI